VLQIEPASQAWKDTYKLLIGAIVPRPIAFVSTVSGSGVLNAAAFSFFNGVCPKPFIVSFAPMLRGSDGSRKDTLRNIEETREFVINIVTEDNVAFINQTAPEFPPDVDEFAVSGLTPVASVKVKAPRVAECPVQFECELEQILSFGDEPGAGSLVLGRVVLIHVHPNVYDDGRILPDALRAVGRMAGSDYVRTTSNSRFELSRPTL